MAEPSAETRRGASKTGLIALGAGAALLVVAGGVVLRLRFASAPHLPFALGSLPEEVTTVESVDPDAIYAAEVELRREDLPEEGRWAQASIFCGGDDLFHALLDVDQTGGVEKLAAQIADKERAKATLSCGKALAHAAKKTDRQNLVTLRVAHAPQRISLVRLDLKDLPETTKLLKSAKAPDHLENARCEHATEDGILTPSTPSLDLEPPPDGARPSRPRDPDADCPFVVAKIERQPLWLGGTMPGVKAFGEGYSPDGKNKIDKAELFEKVLNGLSGTQVLVGYGEDVSALSPVRDDETREKTRRILRDVEVWGAAFTYEGVFVRAHEELHATKESDAKDIAEALERYFKEQKRELKDDDAAARELEDKPAPEPSATDDAPVAGRVKLRAAVRRLAWRAVEEVKVDRSGAVVTVDMAMAPESSDNAAWKEYADANKARAGHAAAILDALAEGSDPSEDDEKALSTRLHAALHPPESVALAGFGDLRVPGGGKCFPVDATSASCAFSRWDKATTSEKIRAVVTKAGFTVTPGASDATLVAAKGADAVTIDIYATPSKGSHVTFTAAPPKPAP